MRSNRIFVMTSTYNRSIDSNADGEPLTSGLFLHPLVSCQIPTTTVEKMKITYSVFNRIYFVMVLLKKKKIFVRSLPSLIV